jgi:hypothetical protein
LKTAVPFEPEKFRAAVKQGGGDARRFELQLRATVERRDGRYYLRPVGVTQQFVVRETPLARKLEAFIGKQVRARGTLISAGPPLTLELTDVAPP